MNYISTRANYEQVSAAEAIRLGMVPTGGLFVPEKVPTFSQEEIYRMKEDSYQNIAYKILERYLTDYTDEELKDVIRSAYNDTNFDHADIAPIIKLDDKLYILELWHGPTAAFKDMALQLMPHLLIKALAKVKLDKEILILVATSGDTGKAALEGFKDVEGVKIVVFYPQGGVSEVQERQMLTTGGNNTEVIAVEGNFDDCQSVVKDIFGDDHFKELISKNGYQFSSANSINWGRLLPQIIYYFATYAYLLRDGEIKEGDKINISVPTGNFGNILAAYYAYQMGLPVNKFICASNDNKVLTDFFKTGIYDINRDFKQTISPSMDILISSNLERFLFEMTGHDADKINSYYESLNEEGKFAIDEDTKIAINDLFVGEYATEEETQKTITQVFNKFDYTLDTHTAVGVKAYQEYQKEVGDNIVAVIDSTANPYKFSKAVLESLQDIEEENEFKILKELEELTGLEIHRGLQGLEKMEIKHNRSCHSKEIREEIKEILEIE
ncbi:threonine synthase [Natroniella acetigena]|uniref:threonine synthase n=1 Tax=Natroniella acetigena TaxID=52004 RepID=UPI00200B30EF|nr:threonine synthase [Natroniella acetigena]MCK8828191.1 threonine synthase [Natroniella acetigena]